MDFSECEGLRVSFYGFEFCRNHYTSLPRQLQVLQANGASSKELCESKQKEKSTCIGRAKKQNVVAVGSESIQAHGFFIPLLLCRL